MFCRCGLLDHSALLLVVVLLVAASAEPSVKQDFAPFLGRGSPQVSLDAEIEKAPSSVDRDVEHAVEGSGTRPETTKDGLAPTLRCREPGCRPPPRHPPHALLLVASMIMVAFLSFKLGLTLGTVSSHIYAGKFNDYPGKSKRTRLWRQTQEETMAEVYDAFPPEKRIGRTS